jgi:hypothetical protein
MIIDNPINGLGAGGNQIISMSGSLVGSVFGSTAALWAPLIGTTGPIGAAIAGLVAAGAAIAGALGVGEGCGPTCVQATQIVNNAEPTFRANLAAYEAGQISQADAIANYQQMQAAVTQACSGIPGDAGTRCVGDRFPPSACTWKNNGQCWNWNIGYYVPLTQPSQTPMASPVSGNVSSMLSNPMVLVGGILLLVGLTSGDR